MSAACLLAIVLAAAHQDFASWPLDGAWELRPLERGGSPGGEEVPAARRGGGERAPRAAPAWRPCRVPGAFEAVLGSSFDGSVLYRRPFALPEARVGRRWFLRFAAVMTRARVFVDGREVGAHTGGWTPFRVEITEALRARGPHELRVAVDELPGHPLQGFLPAIQPHFGGIWGGVRLERERGPVIDRMRSWFRGDDRGGTPRLTGRLEVRGGAARARLVVEDRAGRRLFETELRLPPAAEGRAPGAGRALDLAVPGGQPWSPRRPAVERLRVELLDSAGRVLDSLTREIAFGGLSVRGRTLLWNGRFLQLRGVLHWGYDPRTLDPGEGRAHWRAEFDLLKKLGFNLVKACLWLPPPAFFAAAREAGVLVWLEYPAWHPDFSTKRLPELLREYDEFFRQDRRYTTIVLRSLTCETGRAQAPEKTVRALFERCKEVTDGLLVEDDSSWISWPRFADFYDDHPYGNAGPWAERLRGFDRYIEEHGRKPFVLGEAIAADTWADLAGIAARAARDPDPWWRPLAFESQRAFERRLQGWYGERAGARLIDESKAFALAERKFQIEVFRRLLPRAGYVSSVLRDIPQCRMGYLDDLGRPKWRPEDFAWHGDEMLVLDEVRARRALAAADLARVRPKIRLAGDAEAWHGRTVPLTWRYEREVFEPGRGYVPAGRPEVGRRLVELAAARTGLSRAIELPWPKARPAARPERWLLRAELVGLARNHWTFHVLPGAGRAGTGPSSRSSGPAAAEVRVARGLDAELLAWVERGGRLLLRAGGRGGPRSGTLWWLQGAPFAPLETPLFARVPRRFLFELFDRDLDGRPFADTRLLRAFEPLLGFWDTHDEREAVQVHWLLAEARAGEGRILLCGLDLDPRPETAPFAGAGAPARPNPARAFLEQRLRRHLAEGPAPRAVLPEDLLADWRAALESQRVPLDSGWRLRPDPNDRGLQEGWQRPGPAGKAWRPVAVRRHWEAAGLPHYDGVAWYRLQFAAPSWWRPGRPLYLVCDGVDDSYTLFVNGRRAAAYGDPATGETVWLVRTVTDIGSFVQPGSNLLVLRVVDHGGAGGLHRPVYLLSAKPELEDLIDK